MGHESIDGHNGFRFPFGYYLQLDNDLVMLRRADGSDVAEFDLAGLDLFDVEFAVWEDAD